MRDAERERERVAFYGWSIDVKDPDFELLEFELLGINQPGYYSMMRNV